MRPQRARPSYFGPVEDDRLDLSALEASVAALGRLPLVGEVDDVHRDAAIQRFEFTYEVCWRMMRRHLRWAGVVDTELMGRRELFREAARHGLITDPLRWIEHHDARNATSHNYDEANAQAVFVRIAGFYEDARHLLAQLNQRHA